ncbi:Endonuclease/exonuclease/phosphatase [Massariosphaeria phaeospora]|uniref:Endonuclease/exonuclease/phosphatase n=1 Tax=Massariosphaeria phaeospora TaxID=100035 RepID=A0A7C8I5K8_9PLEO|nr:Endonuclease/exonuclease/phosphatase [Massariosphaeria phaeospora]
MPNSYRLYRCTPHHGQPRYRYFADMSKIAPTLLRPQLHHIRLSRRRLHAPLCWSQRNMSLRTPILASLEIADAAQMRDEAFYKARPQSCWYHDGSSWLEALPSRLINTNLRLNNTLRLISWNIDFSTPFAEERMSAALEHLEDLILSAGADVPVVVYLQEMENADLELIRESRWIQDRFILTEMNARNWQASYGTTMLIDRRLAVESVFRVPWYSGYGRDGLFLDIALKAPEAEPVSGAGAGSKVLRLCNTHLESLAADPPVRPAQMGVAGKYLREPNVAAALFAGDLNAIESFDRILHTENGLSDAYLELGGKEDSDDGYTWGYQSPHTRFACCRMDKILFRGSIKPIKFARIGIDVKVTEDKRKEVRDAGQAEWVTDHYGVMGDFEIGQGGELGLNEAQENLFLWI